MPTAQKRLQEMLRDHFAPRLRAMGFKGSGKGYLLGDEQAWLQIGVQSSISSTAEEVYFTINVSCIGKAVWEDARQEMPHLGEKPAPNMMYPNLGWFLRIGFLTPDRRALWWAINEDSDLEAVCTEVVESIRVGALPALYRRRHSR